VTKRRYTVEAQNLYRDVYLLTIGGNNLRMIAFIEATG